MEYHLSFVMNYVIVKNYLYLAKKVYEIVPKIIVIAVETVLFQIAEEYIYYI